MRANQSRISHRRCLILIWSSRYLLWCSSLWIGLKGGWCQDPPVAPAASASAQRTQSDETASRPIAAQSRPMSKADGAADPEPGSATNLASAGSQPVREEMADLLRAGRNRLQLRTKAHAVTVFSGPGWNWYPTMILPPATTVEMVGELSRGKWVKIVPPLGSFNWVRASDCVELPDGTIRLARDRVKLGIGNAFNDEGLAYQSELFAGDRLTVIDEVERVDGHWFKVLPPTDEVRYIALEDLELPNYAAPSEALAQEVWAKHQASLANPPVNSTDPSRANPALASTVPEPGQIPALTPINGWRETSFRAPTQTEPKTGPKFLPTMDPTAPWPDRFRTIRHALRLMRTRTPEYWTILEMQAAVEQLAQTWQNADETDRRAVREMQQILQAMQELQERFANNQRRWQEVQAKDAELAALQARTLGLAEAVNAAVPFTGLVERATRRIDDRVAYQLKTSNGITSHYLLPVPGLSLDSFLHRPVRILGKLQNRPDLPYPVIYVEEMLLQMPEVAAPMPPSNPR